MKPVTNVIFVRMFKKLLPVLGVMTGLSLGSFLAIVRLVDIKSYRMEQMLAFSGIPMLFYLAFLCAPLLMIYTLFTTLLKADRAMRLPPHALSPLRLYLSFYLAGCLLLAVTAVVYLFTVLLCGALLSAFTAHIQDGYMHNYLFLAFVRSPSLRLLLPFSPVEAVRLLVLLFSLPAAVLCGCYSFRYHHYENFLWLLIYGIGYYQMLGISQDINDINPLFSWGRLAVLILFGIYFSLRSLFCMRHPVVRVRPPDPPDGEELSAHA